MPSVPTATPKARERRGAVGMTDRAIIGSRRWSCRCAAVTSARSNSRCDVRSVSMIRRTHAAAFDCTTAAAGSKHLNV